MNRGKNFLFYIITVGGFLGLILYILHRGTFLENVAITNLANKSLSNWKQFKETLHHNLTHPLATLLFQIITIILVARSFGFLSKKIKQPTVVGEIIAGIFLGPSVVGLFFPGVSEFLFPVKSLANLQFLSQIGLILFMFVIGMELDLNVLKNKAKDAVVISHASIIFPFALGITLAYFLYGRYAPDKINFISFSLFIGISMSITAFPVLARIVQERGLSKTRLGAIAITCAAADDITAWCLLAGVIAVVKAGSVFAALYTIALAAIYVVVMLKIIQPFLKKLGEKYTDKESISKPIVAIFFITLLVSSYTTEVVGIHALFGAFMAGVIMPVNVNFRSVFIEKVEDVALVLLLPLFFVFTGLRTQIGLLNSVALWQTCAVIIAIAVTGKFVGSVASAKFVGQSWRDSLSIGALMNTRGLMELIVLNIGYDLGVLSAEIFAMLVLMALITTFMTGPALDLINKFFPEKKVAVTAPKKEPTSNILVAFSTAVKGISLMKLANLLSHKSGETPNITMLHLSPSNDLNAFNMQEYEKASIEPVALEARQLQVPINTLFKPSVSISSDIIHFANAGEYNLLLIGIGKSVYEGTFLGRLLGFTSKIIDPERLYSTITGHEKLFKKAAFEERVTSIVRSVKIPVGVFIDKDIKDIKKVLIPFFDMGDSFLLEYAKKLVATNDAAVTIVDISGLLEEDEMLQQNIQSMQQASVGSLVVLSKRRIDKEILIRQELLLISIDSWKKAFEMQSNWLTSTPSVLIMKK
ncbi:cation:proton antiporter [Segetibacter aerophilus]|uniref:Cation/H(+) antiporter n=1 Tax=Segetibacter aerophilus TaxID=670293 RepID=A0A512BIZ5_9BACT|nr:cation:proton antiporter [Segetibacter aerophilus]GEO11845.1 cation/H(+) antiporter [Segetibacter aerophilus]